MTSKGAVITLASTTASCYLACQIENKAHRLIYHYYPMKYANVEYANGLTREQLDKAYMLKVEHDGVNHEKPVIIEESAGDLRYFQLGLSDTNRFWKESTEIFLLPRTAEEFAMAQREIIACSMTG